jgi:hypothetical protein
MDWESTIRERLQRFAAAQPGDGVPVSIRVRVFSGCFHREHSSRAFALIDQAMATHGREAGTGGLELVEHETGPELLVALGLAGGGLSLAASLVQLVVAILQARSAGVAKGDQPDEPVELIVRRVLEGGRFEETVVVRARCGDPVRADQIRGLLESALAPRTGTGTADPIKTDSPKLAKALVQKKVPKGKGLGRKRN